MPRQRSAINRQIEKTNVVIAIRATVRPKKLKNAAERLISLCLMIENSPRRINSVALPAEVLTRTAASVIVKP